MIGRTDAGIEATRRATQLDPLWVGGYANLGIVLQWARRYNDAIKAFNAALAIDPGNSRVAGMRGQTYYLIGDYERARASCEIKRDTWDLQVCLALAYNKLGRHRDAEDQLMKLEKDGGESAASAIAEIYAQWGDASKALEWLETALKTDDGVFESGVDPFLDPIRHEPRYQAVQQKLGVPDSRPQ